MRTRMSESQIYDERYLDMISGYTEIRREEDVSRATGDWLQNFANDEVDAATNYFLQGHTDRRGRQLEGFEFIRSSGRSMSDSEFDAMVQERKRIEFAADPDATARVMARLNAVDRARAQKGW